MSDSVATEGASRANRTGRASRLGVILLILLAIPIGLYAFLFQLQITGSSEFHQRFSTMSAFALMHVVFGGTLLIIGGFQFVSGLRRRHLNLHRWLGRTYLACVLVSGVGGLWLATNATGGFVTRYGFGLLAIVWLYTGWRAYRAVRAGNIGSHQNWMARNYALTFGAVTLRIQLGLFQFAGLSFEEAYPITAWLSWVPNLLLIEWFYVQRPRTPSS